MISLMKDKLIIYFRNSNDYSIKFYIFGALKINIIIKMRFSVIIPIYNVENYLAECIDSVLAQNFRDYEIILVDDGSLDNSGKICDKYAEKYAQIKVIHKENGGLSDARNFGMKEAKGEYLMFLDSDDYWEGTDILLDIFDILKKDNFPDLVLHGFSRKLEARAEPHLQNIEINENNGFANDLEYLVKKGIYYNSICTKIIKREILINNNLFFERGLLHEDIPYCFDLAFYIKNYSIYNSNFYQYRVRKGSITSKISKKNIQHLSKSILKKLDILLQSNEKISLLGEGLKTLIMNDLYFSFRHFLRSSVKDLLSLYPYHKKIWEKSCKVWGKEYMNKKYFNGRKIAFLPFPLAILIVYIEQKIYKY